MSPVFGPCLIFQIAGYCRLEVHRLDPIVPVLSMISVAFYSGISVYFSLWFNIFPRLELCSGGSTFYGDSHARRIQQKKESVRRFTAFLPKREIPFSFRGFRHFSSPNRGTKTWRLPHCATRKGEEGGSRLPRAKRRSARKRKGKGKRGEETKSESERD